MPAGLAVAFASADWLALEAAGVAAAADAAFVLVAGGRGERLGYGGIKLALPSETTSGACFLELYVAHIRARAWAAAPASACARAAAFAAMSPGDGSHACKGWQRRYQRPCDGVCAWATRVGRRRSTAAPGVCEVHEGVGARTCSTQCRIRTTW